VEWCRKNLEKGTARALVVNSGNANAFTGKTGAQAVKMTADIAARAAGCRASQVFVASTGVIGEPLDARKFEGVLEDCEARATPAAWLDAARAIMTTDTFPKVATRSVGLGGVPVTINGIAKGAGMIAPDMATMLSFVFTDAPIAAAVLQALLKKGAEKSFNCVTVDGDTSTSDTLLLFATGAAAGRGAPAIALPSDRRLAPFRAALEDLLVDLVEDLRAPPELRVDDLRVPPELRRRRPPEVRRSDAGISSCATALVSCGIWRSRNFAIRSSSRRIDFASCAVSLSPTDVASVSRAV
jgi:glutamate N-acetyltransferase/amino-acid N-acetyltransferase